MKHLRILLFFLVFIPSISFAQNHFLIGTQDGLYRIQKTNTVKLLTIPEVKKIIQTSKGWYILSNAGIHYSSDLVSFEQRNEGLPNKVIKTFTNREKAFFNEVQDLKDLEAHPTNPDILITATKDAVFVSKDAGLTWKNVGISAATTGVKAVAIAHLPDANGIEQLVYFMSHPIYGVSWKYDFQTKWTDITVGLDKVPSIKWPDEIADIHVSTSNGTTEVYVSQTFMPRIYTLNWQKKEFEKIWSGENHIDTIESLQKTKEGLVFVSPNSILELKNTSLLQDSNKDTYQPAHTINDWKQEFARLEGHIQCAWIPADQSKNRGNLSLSELWLTNPSTVYASYAQTANEKKGNYIPVHQVVTEKGLNDHLKTLKDNNLNMLVIDMKDDYGYIRYDTKDPLVLEKGKLGRGIELESFVKKAKEQDLFLVARIVVFKDKSLASWGNSKYAVWDRTEKKAWQGYELIKNPEYSEETAATEPERIRKYYDEHWVDPYSEEVWEYNIAVAKELIERGFDEIQFDYIRFPTDGLNLNQAQYRWQEAGMDKESALMSFLVYARQEIQAPISIDIYGANGWYRTGARTGQDVEILARYVDVICPMFYPSHFEQIFLAQNPALQRPYRIYYYGSFRNTIIARNHVIIRPWAQAFYLNVSYDRAWYNKDYVQLQIFGIRDSINQGYTYWNNSGRYEDLRKDIDLNTSYPWAAPEESKNKTRPAFGK